MSSCRGCLSFSSDNSGPRGILGATGGPDLGGVCPFRLSILGLRGYWGQLGLQLSGVSVLFVCQIWASGATGAPAVGGVCSFRLSILGLGGNWGQLGVQLSGVSVLFVCQFLASRETEVPSVSGICSFRLSFVCLHYLSFWLSLLSVIRLSFLSVSSAGRKGGGGRK